MIESGITLVVGFVLGYAARSYVSPTAGAYMLSKIAGWIRGRSGEGTRIQRALSPIIDGPVCDVAHHKTQDENSQSLGPHRPDLRAPMPRLGR